MPKKPTRTPIDKPDPKRASEPLIREGDEAICLERRTIYEHTPGVSHYQSLIAEPLMVDGEPGVLIDIATMEQERIQYYLTMEEVTRLAGWLTKWTKAPIVQTDSFMRNLRRNLGGYVPQSWLQSQAPANEAPVPRQPRRKRGGPTNG
jgi:hypothetical protein